MYLCNVNLKKTAHHETAKCRQRPVDHSRRVAMAFRHVHHHHTDACRHRHQETGGEEIAWRSGSNQSNFNAMAAHASASAKAW